MAIRQNGGTDIWIYELGAHTTTRLTTDGFSAAPSWTADGKRVAYISGRGRKFTLLVRSWDGSGSADTLHVPTSVPRNIIFSPRGRLFVVPQGIAANTDFYAGSLDSVEKTWPLVATPANEQSPAISKDGRWLAYSSTETGANQVYVRALPGPGGRFQVSTDGGGEPLWAPDGRRLLYRTGTHMMAATLSLGEQAIVTRRDTLFEDVFAREGGRQAYDISPDGKTLVVGRLIGSDARMVIVVNWLDEMRDRMALATRK